MPDFFSGLGQDYNKDLMMRLSQQSDGNHTLIENTTDAVRIFKQEFIDLAWVVVQEVDVTLTCTENMCPLNWKRAFWLN